MKYSSYARMVNGKESLMWYPWMASIQVFTARATGTVSTGINMKEAIISQGECGGALISYRCTIC